MAEQKMSKERAQKFALIVKAIAQGITDAKDSKVKAPEEVSGVVLQALDAAGFEVCWAPFGKQRNPDYQAPQPPAQAAQPEAEPVAG